MDPTALLDDTDIPNDEKIEGASPDERLALLAQYAAKLDDEALQALTYVAEGLTSRRHLYGALDVDNEDRNAQLNAPPNLRNAISVLGRRLVRSGQ